MSDIRVTKTPDFKGILKALKVTDEVVASVAEGFIVGIQNRTQKGKDMNNKVFKGYKNDDYIKRRKKAGRSAKVNLTFNGQMLNSIRSQKYRDGARIYFNSSTETNKAHGNHHKLKRPFFGLDDKQEEYMYKRIGTFIAKGLK
jgi:hypothetical protein